jgi:ubiquinone/menaquinone biosynthesis C-methylase UbiE
MRKDAIEIEEARVGGIHELNNYKNFRERYRIFPDVFENRKHKTILDVAAGVGVVGKRIKDHYPSDLLCNDISPTCLNCMEKMGIKTISFDIDDNENPFPFSNESIDAVIALATIEHVIHIDHFMQEIHRILSKNGYLYISAPNYSGILYLLPFLISGKTFHDPLSEGSKYEFYAHVRYFTYKTLFDFVSSFGFYIDSVYLPVPKGSSNYQALKAKSKLKAIAFRLTMKSLYTFFSPRWASEPVLCFRKSRTRNRKIRKILL